MPLFAVALSHLVSLVTLEFDDCSCILTLLACAVHARLVDYHLHALHALHLTIAACYDAPITGTYPELSDVNDMRALIDDGVDVQVHIVQIPARDHVDHPHGITAAYVQDVLTALDAIYATDGIDGITLTPAALPHDRGTFTRHTVHDVLVHSSWCCVP